VRGHSPWVYSAAMAKMRIGTLAAAVMSTSLVVGVPAHADNGSDFLAMVSAEGLNAGDTPEDVIMTLADGAEICHIIDESGFTPEVAGRQVNYMFPKATPQQVAGFVAAAQAKLCPQLAVQLQPGGGSW
jgi:hypothetical protein